MTAPRMRILDSDDGEWLAQAAFFWPRTRRWESGGLTPQPERLAQLMWGEVGTQRVFHGSSGQPAALVQVTDIDLHSGYGYLSILADGVEDGTPWHAGLTDSLLRTVFDDFPLRHLYVEVASDCYSMTVASFAPRAESVGCLKAFLRRSSDLFVDLLIYKLDQ